eukprot:9228141-Alexandrium_andersonii.AAC.1
MRAARPSGDACRTARPSPSRARGAPRCRRGDLPQPRAFARGPEPCSAPAHSALRHSRERFAQERLPVGPARPNGHERPQTGPQLY